MDDRHHVPTIFLDSNEAQEERNEHFVKPMQDYFGDRLIVAGQELDISWYARGKQWWLERKVTPSDLLASIRDGRLKKQAFILAETSGFLLLEGSLEYDIRGYVLDGSAPQGFDRKQITGLLGSLQRSGVTIMWSPSAHHSPAIIHEAYLLSMKTGSNFLAARPRPKYDWGAPTRRQKVLYAFQGFGMGPKQAEAAWRHSGSLREFLDMSEAEIMEIPGFGKVRASKVEEIISEEWSQEKP
jgi:ERCC4-type nuclease